MKILAVDDEPLVLRLLDATLKSIGYQNNDFAATGSHALHLLKQAKSPYSCILLDIQMPGMNGIELCQQIRQIPAYRHTPILMLTAMTEKHYIDESFASGATDYINKPIDAIELGARLRVARLIHSERQRTDYLEALQNAKTDTIDVVPNFEFSEPVQINDVPRVVNAMAFENYLAQLDRLGLFKIGMIGFQIRHAMSLYSSNTPEDFHGILCDVSEAIFENTRQAHALISYVGSGSFVAVVPRVKLFEREELESGISMTLHEFQLAELLGPEYDIKVKVGPQVNGTVFGNSPQRMIDQALHALEDGPSHQSLTSRLLQRAG